jgi:hypothetical protein
MAIDPDAHAPVRVDAVAIARVHIPGTLSAARPMEVDPAGSEAADGAGAEGADRWRERGDGVLVAEGDVEGQPGGFAGIEHAVVIAGVLPMEGERDR